MPRQEFRLRTLKRLRESQRDALRGRLAEAVRAAVKLDEQRAELVEEIRSLVADRGEITRSASPRVERLLASQRYEAAVRTKLGALDDDRRKVAEEVERRRAALVEGEREVGVLEKLEERHDERVRADELRAEVAEMDEIASRRVARFEGMEA